MIFSGRVTIGANETSGNWNYYPALSLSRFDSIKGQHETSEGPAVSAEGRRHRARGGQNQMP